MRAYQDQDPWNRLRVNRVFQRFVLMCALRRRCLGIFALHRVPNQLRTMV